MIFPYGLGGYVESDLYEAVRESISEVAPWLRWCHQDYALEESRGWIETRAEAWAQRQRLRGKPLALWLHGFYASHAAPYSLTVAYLHKLSGSRTKRLRKFKENLIRALRDLEAVGAIQAFEIRDELVHVRTVPSKSQQKHLAVRRSPDRRRK